MSELSYGTETAEPAADLAQEGGDNPGYDEAGLGAGYEGILRRPHEASQADALTGQATQPDGGLADPESTLEADLKELKAEYEASLKKLKAEVQALKDRQPDAPDAPGNTESEADQPRLNDRKLPVEQRNPEEREHQDDRPGLRSNAKYALYGAVGTTATMALLDRFAPGISRVVEDMVVAGPTVIGALVPTLREGWKRKHDNSPNKP